MTQLHYLFTRPRGPLPKKMPHKDRPPADDSRTKCRTFSFFLSPVTLAIDPWPWYSNSGEIFIQRT